MLSNNQAKYYISGHQTHIKPVVRDEGDPYRLCSKFTVGFLHYKVEQYACNGHQLRINHDLVRFSAIYSIFTSHLLFNWTARLQQLNFSNQTTLIFQEHFLEVIQNQEFLLLPTTEIVKLLSSDDINVPDEETIFQALMMWVRYDVQHRQRDLGLLLANIRLPLLPPQVYLLHTISLCDLWSST